MESDTIFFSSRVSHASAHMHDIANRACVRACRSVYIIPSSRLSLEPSQFETILKTCGKRHFFWWGRRRRPGGSVDIEHNVLFAVGSEVSGKRYLFQKRQICYYMCFDQLNTLFVDVFFPLSLSVFYCVSSEHQRYMTFLSLPLAGDRRKKHEFYSVLHNSMVCFISFQAEIPVGTLRRRRRHRHRSLI